MWIERKRDMRFFIVCPANYVTGGTELLHQLSWCLSNMGMENYMLYTGGAPGISPTPDVFMKYQVRYTTYFIDHRSSVLITPELFIETMNLCKKGRKVIWWLSVDNYLSHYSDKIRQQGKVDVFGLGESRDILHFVQSRYAAEFVKGQFGVKQPFFLSDYISDVIRQVAKQYGECLPKENICLYNPQRGAENLVEIRDRCREDIQWIPLQGMKPDQIAMLMCRAKVYIDFGSHPGKDRIPREAAVCGCCIITNREGSAAYAEDVGIPEKYKISDMQDYDRVLETIYDLVDNYSDRSKDYKKYVTTVLGEKAQFERETANMLSIVSEDNTFATPAWEDNRYDAIIGNLQELVNRIDAYYKNVKDLYAARDIDSAIKELLKVEGGLSMLREVGYIMINDMLSGDE